MKSEVLVIGDVMLDRYVDGSCERISPEAPVPILNALEETYILGGAANVALNLKKLGIDTSILGTAGNDFYGSKLQELIVQYQIGNFILPNHVQTTVKTRITAKSQQLLRVDRETMYAENEEINNHLTTYLSLKNPTLIIVSDYGKGMVSESIMRLLVEYGERTKNCKILVDPKGIDWNKYNGTFLIKPNVKEIGEIIGRTLTNSDITEDLMKSVFDSYKIENLLLTQSSMGMSLINKDQFHHFPTKKADVFDVTGAGDTAIAVLAYGLYKKASLFDAIELANKASTYVISKNKTYAISLDELNEL